MLSAIINIFSLATIPIKLMINGFILLLIAACFMGAIKTDFMQDKIVVAKEYSEDLWQEVPSVYRIEIKKGWQVAENLGQKITVALENLKTK